MDWLKEDGRVAVTIFTVGGRQFCNLHVLKKQLHILSINSHLQIMFHGTKINHFIQTDINQS